MSKCQCVPCIAAPGETPFCTACLNAPDAGGLMSGCSACQREPSKEVGAFVADTLTASTEQVVIPPNTLKAGEKVMLTDYTYPVAKPRSIISVMNAIAYEAMHAPVEDPVCGHANCGKRLSEHLMPYINEKTPWCFKNDPQRFAAQPVTPDPICSHGGQRRKCLVREHEDTIAELREQIKTMAAARQADVTEARRKDERIIALQNTVKQMRDAMEDKRVQRWYDTFNASISRHGQGVTDAKRIANDLHGHLPPLTPVAADYDLPETLETPERPINRESARGDVAALQYRHMADDEKAFCSDRLRIYIDRAEAMRAALEKP